MPKRRRRNVNRVHVGFFAAITARETLCILATGFGHAKQPQREHFPAENERRRKQRDDGFALLVLRIVVSRDFVQRYLREEFYWISLDEL